VITSFKCDVNHVGLTCIGATKVCGLAVCFEEGMDGSQSLWFSRGGGFCSCSFKAKTRYFALSGSEFDFDARNVVDGVLGSSWKYLGMLFVFGF
jgi:hypothetical protein